MYASRLPHPFLLGSIALLVALAMLDGGVRPVAAAPPKHRVYTEQFANLTFAECDGFQILGSAIVDFRATTFFDAAGNPDHLQVHIHYLGTIKNSATGATLPDTGHLIETLDLTTGEERITRLVGLNYQTTVPGLGTIVKDVGLVIVEPDGELILRGPHEFGEGGGYVAFCPFLT